VKLLQVFNQYRSLFNGENTVVEQTAQLVEKHGGQVRMMLRSSRDIDPGVIGKTSAFLSGIYSRRAYLDMTRVLREDRPDVVHAHNLYPLFSPSVLVACRRAGVPVVLSVHNQQMTCPKSDHLYRGNICERCIGGKEYHCVLQNCRENIFESIAYAARSLVARRMKFFHDNVTLLIALSQFAKTRLIEAGFREEQIVVLSNMVHDTPQPVVPDKGQYVAFAGRLSPEKGVETLLAAARELPEINVRLAGDGPLESRLRSDLPPNVQMLGRLESGPMKSLYRGARFFVLPSRSYEMCPLVILEAMSHGLPVITSRLGGQAELVEDGVTGFLFDPNDPQDLARKMQRLWEDPQLCQQFGAAGFALEKSHYGEETYYRRLRGIYDQAIALTGNSEPQMPELTMDNASTSDSITIGGPS
jgi:glycosyltransferase involved in cell wall biosynthesis